MGEGGAGGRMVVILRVQDFCFEHVIKVEIFFFPRGHIYFSARVLRNIVLLLIISRGKWVFFAFAPPVPSFFYWSIPNYFFDVISAVAAVPAKLPP